MSSRSSRAPAPPTRASVFVPRYEVSADGHRVPALAAVQPGHRLVQAAAWFDVALAAAAVPDAFETWVLSAGGYGRFIGRFVVAAGAWAVLAWQCGAMRPMALRIRRTLCAVGLLAVAARLLITGPFPDAVMPRMALACVGFAFGGIACHRALRLRARELCEAHPDRSECRGVTVAWTPRRLSIVLSALEWLACGAVETWLGNVWFGQVVMAGGVLGVVLAKDLARPPGDRRLPPQDRERARPWYLFAVLAPLFLFRAIWLLRVGS